MFDASMGGYPGSSVTIIIIDWVVDISQVDMIFNLVNC